MNVFIFAYKNTNLILLFNQARTFYCSTHIFAAFSRAFSRKTSLSQMQQKRHIFIHYALSQKKHMACCKKYKPYILKYKALISKYMPYIFRRVKSLINNNLYTLSQTALFV